MLLAWFPLNNTTTNLGESDISLIHSDQSYNPFTADGILGRYTYNNTSYSSGGFVSDRKLALGTKQSMFAWMRFVSLTSNSSLGGAILGTHRYSTNSGMGITIKYVSSTTGYLSVNTGNGSSRTFNEYCGTTLLQANTWYHVGFTYDGSYIRIYVNGNLEKSQAYTGMYVPDDYLILGAWSLNGTTERGLYANYKLYGQIQDARVYNHVLSEHEIKLLARGLVFHYDFENLYLPIPFLITSGSQYFDTGVSIKGNTRVETKVKIDAFASYYMLYGAWDIFSMSPRSDYTLCVAGGGSSSQPFPNSSTTFNTSTVYEIDHRPGAITINGTSYSLGGSSNTTSSRHILFGAASNSGDTPYSGWYSRARFYYFKIYEGDDLIRDYVPMLRKIDKVVGMYDRVTGQFYTSATAFVAPSDYTINSAAVMDCSGNGIDGVAYNSFLLPSTEYCPIGKTAYKTPNSTSYILVSSDVLNKSMSEYTLAVWFKLGATGKMPFGCGWDTYCYGDNSWKYTGGELYYNHNGGPVSTSDWVFWVATLKNNTLKIYRNGKFESSTTQSSAQVFSNFYIGNNYPAGSNYITTNQRIGDIKLYARALSEDDIIDLYETREKIDSSGNIYCAMTNTRSTTAINTKNSIGFDYKGVISSSNIVSSSKSTYIKGTNLMQNTLDYQPFQLQYITFTGSQSFTIPLTITDVNQYPLRCVFKCATDDTASPSATNAPIAGISAGGWNGPIMLNFCNNKCEWGTNGYTVSFTTYTPKVFYEYEYYTENNLQRGFRRDSVLNQPTLIVNGTRAAVTGTQNLYIGKMNNAYFKGKLCYFQIYSKNELLYNLIPFKYNWASNMIGLYDTVHNQGFFPAGAVTAGPVEGPLNVVGAPNIYWGDGASVAEHHLTAKMQSIKLPSCRYDYDSTHDIQVINNNNFPVFVYIDNSWVIGLPANSSDWIEVSDFNEYYDVKFKAFGAYSGTVRAYSGYEDDDETN